MQEPPVTPPVYKSVEFWAAFVALLLFNGLVGGISYGLLSGFSSQLVNSSPAVSQLLSLASQLLPLFACAVNVIAPILLAVLHRRRAALGILAAWAFMFVLALIAGIFLTVACFSSLNNL